MHEIEESKSTAIDYVEALKRPFKDTKKLAIGSILGAIPVVNFAVIGYTMSSTGLTEEKVNRDSLPEWANYLDLFKKGILAILIGITLSLPSALVLLGSAGTVIFNPALEVILGTLPFDSLNDLSTVQIPEAQMEHWLTQNWTEFIPLLTNAAPLLILAILLALTALYLVPIALMGWLKEDSFTAAFRWGNLKKAMTLDYCINWLIVGYLVGIVNTLFEWIPLIGIGAAMYIGGVFSYTVFSKIYERTA